MLPMLPPSPPRALKQQATGASSSHRPPWLGRPLPRVRQTAGRRSSELHGAVVVLRPDGLACGRASCPALAGRSGTPATPQVSRRRSGPTPRSSCAVWSGGGLAKQPERPDSLLTSPPELSGYRRFQRIDTDRRRAGSGDGDSDRDRDWRRVGDKWRSWSSSRSIRVLKLGRTLSFPLPPSVRRPSQTPPPDWARTGSRSSSSRGCSIPATPPPRATASGIASDTGKDHVPPRLL